MDANNKILHNIPLFRHCSDDEISYLMKIGRVSDMKRGQLFDLKKVSSLNIVINGVFEIEAPSKGDVVYFAPGSFFGNIPFSNNRNRGMVRAVIDSKLLIFSEEDIYRFFLVSYKGLRGYIKSLDRIGLDISDVGEKYFGENSRVSTVYSPYSGSGKSFFASLLGLTMSSSGRTIVLDLSYSGNSIFNYFERKITSPLSQKQDSSPGVEKMIHDRIERISDSLDILNISFGAKVKVDPGILSPILFFLSKEYRHIIIDLSDYDRDLRDRTFDLSDNIFTLIRKKKEMETVYESFDRSLNDGQRVYYIANEHFAGDVRNFRGGLILDRFEPAEEGREFSRLEMLNEKNALGQFLKLITEKKRALVLESNILESILYSGFFKKMNESGIKYDIIYSSSFSYIMAVFYMLSSDEAGYKKRVASFFSEDRINSYLDVTFPEEHVFKGNSVHKMASELAGDSRIEMLENIPIAMLSDSDSGLKRLFSTGYLKDMVTSSFLINPIFESHSICDSSFNSGYPFHKVRVEDLFRTDTDEIINLSVNNRQRLHFREGRVLKFYKKYIDFLEDKQYDEKISSNAHRNIVIDVNEKDFKIDKLMRISEEKSEELIKNN